MQPVRPGRRRGDDHVHQRVEQVHEPREAALVDRLVHGRVDGADHRVHQFGPADPRRPRRGVREEPSKTGQKFGPCAAPRGPHRLDLDHHRGEGRGVGEQGEQHPQPGPYGGGPGGGAAGLLVRPFHGPHHRLRATPEGGHHRVLLAGEQLVEDRAGHPGGPADVADPGARVAVRRHRAGHAVEEPLALARGHLLGTEPARTRPQRALGLTARAGSRQDQFLLDTARARHRPLPPVVVDATCPTGLQPSWVFLSVFRAHRWSRTPWDGMRRRRGPHTEYYAPPRIATPLSEIRGAGSLRRRPSPSCRRRVTASP